MVSHTTHTSTIEPTAKRDLPYIPNVFEASVLKQLNAPWKYYKTQADFSARMAELSQLTHAINGVEIPQVLIAEANFLVSVGQPPKQYSTEDINGAKEQLIANKALWTKVQAIHLYNSLDMKPEITDISQYSDATEIKNLIKKNIEQMPKGNFENSKYIPGNEEKNLLKILHNYGKSSRNPKTEDGHGRFISSLKKSIDTIFKRNNFLEKTSYELEYESNLQQKRKLNLNTPRKDNIMSDTQSEFQLTDEKKEELKGYGITDYNDIKSQADYESVLQKAKEENTPENSSAPKDDLQKDDNSQSNKPENTPLDIKVDENKPEEKQDEKIEAWVKEKAEYYEGLSASGKINGYKQDTTKKGFVAEIEGATINYTSKDSVNVSENTNYKVFDAMLNEPSNVGRPVNFPENANKELATQLYAACIINGNAMQGAVPQQLDEETLAKCGLSTEQIEQVRMSITKEKQNQNEAPSTENTSPNQSNSSTIAEVKKIHQEFNDLKSAGKITTDKDEDGKLIIVAGENGDEKDVAQATKLIENAAQIINSAKENSTSHQETVNKREEKSDAVRAAKLGLTDNDVTVAGGTKITPLEGDAKETYKNTMKKDILNRVMNKYSKER